MNFKHKNVVTLQELMEGQERLLWLQQSYLSHLHWLAKHCQGVLSLSNLDNFGTTLLSSHQVAENDNCILDSKATDHMMFDANNFSHVSPLGHTSIANANGVFYLVTETIIVTFHLLSHHLILYWFLLYLIITFRQPSSYRLKLYYDHLSYLLSSSKYYHQGVHWMW